jgi:tetratricopeptide (TPR) repeat protein
MAKSVKAVQALPQMERTWTCVTQQLAVWIQVSEKSDSYFRPFLLMAMDTTQHQILGMELFEEVQSPAAIYSKLTEWMAQSKAGPHRPVQVLFEEARLAEAIQPLLAGIQVQVGFRPRTPEIADLIRDLEQQADQGQGAPMLAGLLEQPGVTPEAAGRFFAAASEFFERQPWELWSNNDIFAVQVAPLKKPFYVIVVGQAGMEYGMIVFRKWEDVEEFFHANPPGSQVPHGGYHMLMYNRPPLISIRDLQDARTYGWPFAEEHAPTPLVYQMRGIKRPDAKMLRWYEAAMRALLVFLDQKWGEVQEHDPDVVLQMAVAVPVGAETAAVEITWPGGDSRALFDALDWEPEDQSLPGYLDLGEIDAGWGDGGVPTADVPVADGPLAQAQALMDSAWDLEDPQRRIDAAHRALTLSLDCADAYVLLGDEAAQTGEEARAYFQKGVAAARRALGEDFLNDPANDGFYWGIYKTRPLMRALLGLSMVEDLIGNTVEAQRIAREMLRLNPGDNQGVRYLLLEQLMKHGQDDEARELLKQYPGDWSAEWTYTAALLTFRQQGDSPAAREALAKAQEVNPHTPPYLTGKKRIPKRISHIFVDGGSDEAVNYAIAYLEIWGQTPAAVKWLAKRTK